MGQYLKETPMLDYSAATVQALINKRQWANLPPFERILQIYNFVRDEILFGYNTCFTGGDGQCNTKCTLLMALLRAVGIPCRVCAWVYH
jgi:transglutaminase-like putative cysteine protease